MDRIVLVNEADAVVGSCDKLYTHEKGYLHRAFSVFIMNNEGKMLIQKRAKGKYHSGGLWTNSCCSHQLADEELIADVHNRLDFELGVKVDSLRELFVYSYRAELDHKLIENEIDHIFLAAYSGEIKFNRDEVSEVKWVEMNWLLDDVAKRPEEYTYWFKGTVDQVCDAIAAES